MATKPNMVIVASHDTNIGTINLVVCDDAKRQVQHLEFLNVKTPAKGKTPSANFSMTVSEFTKLGQFIPVIQENMILSTLQLTQPVLCAAFVGMEDTANAVKEMFASTLLFTEKNKPETASGPVERKVEDSIIGLLANAILVAAGKSGVLPESYNFEALYEKAYIAASEKAEKLGKDSLGQYRLKAEKTKKNAEATDTTEENDQDGE
jgi:hypothetical protein